VKPFAYLPPGNAAAAVTAVAGDRAAAFLAGGTNLVDHLKLGVATPDVLVDITSLTSDEITDDGAEVVTADGLAGDGLHPVQQAFLDHDGYQCGYCTPGQVCSAVGVLDEAKQGHPSHVTDDLEAEVDLTDDEIRERMSGNLCRCGAYPGILAAVREAAQA